MQIQPTTYKDLPALRLTTSALEAVLLPGQGGKIASLREKGGEFEYLWQRPGAVYRPLGVDTDYVDAECSGYDDMFPTIDPWKAVSDSGDLLVYLDHGEVSRRPCVCTEQDGALLTETRLHCVPAVFRRRLREGRDGCLRIDFTIQNLSDAPMDFIWAAHFLIRAVPGGRLLCPYPEGSQVELAFSHLPAFGKRFDRLAYPLWPDGSRLDESRAAGPDGNSWKYYFADPLPGDTLGYVYPDGRRVLLRFDPARTPYAGIWWCDGAPLPCHAFAPEVATGSFDRPDLARERGQFSVLPPRGQYTFFLEIVL